jgi:hypothetical protein
LPPECCAHGFARPLRRGSLKPAHREHEIIALTVHQTSREVSRYTKAARQRLLAEGAMAKLTGNKTVPLKPITSVPPKKVDGNSI